jgi:hypothetical protein
MRYNLVTLLLLLVAAGACRAAQVPAAKRSTGSAGGSMKTGTTPKADCEQLMNAALPFAEQMLRQHREFYPFGVTMSSVGEISQVGGWTGGEHPPSTEIIELLEAGFRDGAAKGMYRATALVVDVRTVPPGRSAKQDAIAVHLDHKDNYSVQVIFPYSFEASGELRIEEPFAAKGDGRTFGK